MYRLTITGRRRSPSWIVASATCVVRPRFHQRIAFSSLPVATEPRSCLTRDLAEDATPERSDEDLADAKNSPAKREPLVRSAEPEKLSPRATIRIDAHTRSKIEDDPSVSFE
jgi:hypothetical protein